MFYDTVLVAQVHLATLLSGVCKLTQSSCLPIQPMIGILCVSYPFR